MKFGSGAYLSDDVRKQNRYRIIEQYRQGGSQSRTEISAQTELSAGTVTNITTELLKEKILQIDNESVVVKTGSGRPQVKLHLNNKYALIISGSVTFNKIRLNVTNYSGDILDNLETNCDSINSDGNWLAGKINEMVLQAIGHNTAPIVYTIGIQGLTSNDGSRVIWSPILNDSGRKFAPILEKLSDTKVIVANDCAMIAHALSLTESKQTKSGAFAAILMSYGLGLGMHIDGQAFRGIMSSASEFGHITYKRHEGALCRCGKRGCIEAYASDYAIWRTAKGLGSDYLPDVIIGPDEIAQITEKARKGPGPERIALDEAGKALGVGLATLYGLFDPFPVTFVGPCAMAVDLMEEQIRQTLMENYRFQESLETKFEKITDDLTLIEKGCALIGLRAIDYRAAFGVD